MSANPFSEINDNDRTVIRPAPGGRALPAARQQPAPTPGTAADATYFAVPYTHPLTAAASPLVALLARLRGVTATLDMAELRGRIVRALGAFERRARDAGVAPEPFRQAHYAICAALDSAVSETPWGRGWSSLTAHFHPTERGGTERLKDLLKNASRDPAFLPVVELVYTCASLGFLRPLPGSPSDAGELERFQNQAYALIAAHRGAPDVALSPHWAGVSAPYTPRTPFPLWVIGSVAVAAVAALFAWSLHGLNAASDSIYSRMLEAPPAAVPHLDRAVLVRPPPPPPEPPENHAIADNLAATLRQEVEQHQIEIVSTPSATTLRVSAPALFGPRGASLTASGTALLKRVGTVLREYPGPLHVVGYTDNQPSRSVQFPSNFHLSAARAKAVRMALLPWVSDPSRITAEGRADADPIASNNTLQGREQNRRIELIFAR